MSTAKKLVLIAAAYVVAIAGGFAAVAVNEWLIPEDISQTSGGMVAFGDMVLFVFVTGVLGLAPTWFLLKLFAEKAPRALLAVVLVAAAIGPLSWLAVRYFAGSPPGPTTPAPISQLLGPLIAFVAIPRIVLGPVLLVIEAIVFFPLRWRAARVFLVAAALMDLIPMALFVLHMARVRY